MLKYSQKVTPHPDDKKWKAWITSGWASSVHLCSELGWGFGTSKSPWPQGQLEKGQRPRCCAGTPCLCKSKFVATLGKLIYQLHQKLIREAKLTWTLPSLTAGPSSARRRMNKPMLYSFPPRRLNPNPRGPLSSSTGKQPGFCAGNQRGKKKKRDENL